MKNNVDKQIFKEFKCSSCGSNDFILDENGTKTCEYCNTKFYLSKPLAKELKVTHNETLVEEAIETCLGTDHKENEVEPKNTETSNSGCTGCLINVISILITLAILYVILLVLSNLLGWITFVFNW